MGFSCEEKTVCPIQLCTRCLSAVGRLGASCTVWYAGLCRMPKWLLLLIHALFPDQHISNTYVPVLRNFVSYQYRLLVQVARRIVIVRVRLGGLSQRQTVAHIHLNRYAVTKLSNLPSIAAGQYCSIPDDAGTNQSVSEEFAAARKMNTYCIPILDNRTRACNVIKQRTACTCNTYCCCCCCCPQGSTWHLLKRHGSLGLV
jgi:hypothetical protein